LTPRQRAVLERLVRRATSSQALARRARIVLRAARGERNRPLAEDLGVDRETVRLWRDRWAAAAGRLARLEAEADDRALLAAIRAVLADEPRPGGPPRFSAEQVCRVIALACEAPAASGRPVSHWTPQELADEAIKRGIVEQISSRTVGRWLAEAELQPHRVRYWLNNDRPADPERFDAAVRAVCETYQAAPERAAQGAHTISTDEKTGIQALERARPTRPLRPGLVELQEYEYIRHGTQCLIANFEVVTGQLVAPTIGPTRTEEDFAAHIAQTVATDPTAEWLFVVDRLNTHQSESLVRLVAEHCGIPEELGEKGGPGNLGVDGDAGGVPGRPRPPDPVRVHPHAHLLAEPSRGVVQHLGAPPAQAR
jgi:transposase